MSNVVWSQESRDALFGQLFGYMSLVKSTRLGADDGELVARIVAATVALSSQKVFLPEVPLMTLP